MPPTSIDGTDITGATIDGTDVQEITVDGQTVFTAGFSPPDSADIINHYPFDVYGPTQSSNFADQGPNGFDLDTGSTNGMTTINGVQAADFNGTSRIKSDFPDQSQPVHLFCVFDLDDVSTAYHVYDEENSDLGFYMRLRPSFPDWEVGTSGGAARVGTPVATPIIWNALYDGSNSFVRVNGSLEGNVTVGTDGMDGTTIGGRSGSNTTAVKAAWGEWLAYAGDKSSIQSSIESGLADKWGITL